MGVQLASVGRVGSLAAASITAIRTGRLHGDGHVSLLNVPMFHIAGIGGMPPSLMLGATTVIMPTAPSDAEATLDVIESEGVTSLFLVPAQWQVLCAHPDATRHERWGETPIAIVVPADPAVPPTLDDLTSWALGKMASYRSRPAS